MTSDGIAFQLLQQALSASSLRQSVYANNIANADTPGFKRQDVTFGQVLQQTMTAPVAAFGQGQFDIPQITFANQPNQFSVVPQVVTDTSSAVSNNGNNVDITAEMSKLAENQIQYNGLIQDLQSRITRMQTAINN